MPGWLETSGVGEQWKKVAGATNGGEVPAKAFADAAVTIISVFDLISGMGIAKNDMLGNAKTVAALAEKAGDGATLQAMVAAELEGKSDKEVKKLTGDGKTISCALLWLVRGLIFINVLMKVMDENREMKLKDCVLKGYEASLKPHHGMMIRGTFTVAVNAAPSREAFIKNLGDDEASVFAQIKELLPIFENLLKTNRDFLVSKGIEK